MGIFDKISEEKIKKAIREGEFQNLKGEGKPFPPEMFSREPQNEFSLVHDLLKNNGMSLPWLEERKTLLADMNDIREDFLSAWHAANTEQAKNNIKNSFREKIIKINRRILDYNLRSPAARLQLIEMSLSELVGFPEKGV